MRAFLVSRLVFFEPEETMGEVEVAAAPAVSWTELECMEMAEAAEQLIQLSGSCDDGGGGGGGGESSESRSTDSVKCRKAAAGEQSKEVAAESSCAARRCGRFGAENGADGDDEAVIGGGARRRRPRFRSLAGIYGETARLSGDGFCEAEEDEMRRKRKMKKRASDTAADVEVVRPAACMPRRSVAP